MLGAVNNGAYDFYGRFDVSWGLGVSQYLDPQQYRSSGPRWIPHWFQLR